MHALSTLRLAIRSLMRRRAYAAQVIAILAVGIGANTAIFGVVDAVLLRSLPYDHPESIVVAFADGTARGASARSATTAGGFVDWREQSDAFTGLAALRNVSPRITSVEAPVVPLTHAVSANYFDVLGAKPLLGRGFKAGEDRQRWGDVVVLAYGLWQSVFGGDGAIVGKSIDLDGRPYTVVGVMPADFYSAHIFAVQPGLWIPMSYDVQRMDRTTRDVLVYGRVKPGVTMEAAQASMTAVADRVARDHPDTDAKWSVLLVPLRDHVLGSFTRIGALVLAAVGLVLLIACANVANLALARGAERAGDVAIRTALGATRGRIAAELLTESLVLSLAGGAIGTLVAIIGIPAVAHLIPSGAGVPFLNRVGVDARVLAFSGLASMICAALAGLLPSRQASRVDIVDGLRSAGRARTASSARRWRDALVVAEVAIAVVVIAAAVLMWRTSSGLDRSPAGFAVDELAKVRTSLRGDAFATPASRIVHFDELQRRLSAIPGVTVASGVSFDPPMPPGLVGAQRLRIPEMAADPSAVSSAFMRVVLPRYFETMGIPVIEGRAITEADVRESARVAVISQSLAKRYFDGRPPIGRQFTVDAPGAMPLQIVGIAGDVITSGVDPAAQPAFYVPYAQNPAFVMSMVMRVPRGEPASVLREAERIAWSISPSTNVYLPETMRQALDTANWRTHFASRVLGGFAVLGLLLAAAGLYAVVSYTVLLRRGEIGVRMVLGANTTSVLLMVLRDGLRVTLMGLVAGNVAAAWLTRTMSGLLYDVTPGDPAVLLSVSAGLTLVAALACLAPALSASRTDPTVAMRRAG